MAKSQKKKLKDKAWKLFSQYIRMRDADDNGMATCVTCGKVDHWKKLQAGHFVPGRTNAVLFVENNVNAQCYSCNVCRHGNLIEYYPYMVKKFGEEEVERLRSLKNETVKHSIGFYEQLIKEMNELIKIESERIKGE